MVTVLPVPTFLSENTPLPLPLRLTTSVPKAVIDAPLSVAVLVASYTLFAALTPLTAMSRLPMLAVVITLLPPPDSA